MIIPLETKGKYLFHALHGLRLIDVEKIEA